MVSCTYCNSPATTIDHVPPKSLFARPRPTTLITVPSCAACNNGAALDDQYFRDMVLWHHRVSELPQAQAQVASMVARVTAASAVGYWNLLKGKLRRLVVRAATGQIIGVAPAIAVDTQRIQRAAQRYLRGLFAHAYGRRLALNASTTVQVDPDAVNSQQSEIERLLAGAPGMIVQQGIFWFVQRTTTDNPKVSVWLLVFFDEYPILAVITEP